MFLTIGKKVQTTCYSRTLNSWTQIVWPPKRPLHSSNQCHLDIIFLIIQELYCPIICSNPILMHLRCRMSSDVSSNTLHYMCSKPWLLFHKPLLSFPLESLDVFVILKQVCFQFQERAQPHCKHCSYFCTGSAAIAALSSNPLQQHTSALMDSPKWHVCCSNNDSFMPWLQHAGSLSSKPSMNA